MDEISLEILVWVDPSKLIPKYESMLGVFIAVVAEVRVESELENDMEAGELGNILE